MVLDQLRQRPKLGENVFLTDITFMFTHSFQLSVFILFHCIIHVSLFLFLAFFLCVWKTLRKTKKISCSSCLVYFPCLVVILKENRKKFSFFFCLLGAFPCKQFFSFLSYFLQKNKNSKNKSVCFFEILFLFFGGREEKTTMKMLSGSHMHYCWSNKDPILPCLLLWINVCRSSLVQCTCTLIIIHTVRSCKWKAIMTIYDEMIEMRKCWYSTYLVFVNMIDVC